jgi:hypothetical protein
VRSFAKSHRQAARPAKARLALELPVGINPNLHLSAGQALLGIGRDLHPRASDSSVTGVMSLTYGMASFLTSSVFAYVVPLRWSGGLYTR